MLIDAGITALTTFISGYTSIGSIAIVYSLFVCVGTLLTLFQQIAPKKLPLLYAAEGTVLTFLFGIASLVFRSIADY